MEIWLTSDSHFGHRNICNFTNYDGSFMRPWRNIEEMDEELISRWNSAVKPNDIVWHLGDVVMNRRFLPTVGKLHGKKHLILGNHDIFHHDDYLPYFHRLYGSNKLDNLLLTHIPVHQDSIPHWALGNVHGHLHANHVVESIESQVRLPRYLNICVENTDYRPLTLNEIKERLIKQQTP